MASRKQQNLSDYIDAVHGNMFVGESIEPDPRSIEERLRETQANLKGRIEEIRKNVWKRPYPIIFDSNLVSQDTSTFSEFHSKETALARKTLFDRLIAAKKIELSDTGPRLARSNGVIGRLILIGTSTVPVAGEPPKHPKSLNDEQLEVLMRKAENDDKFYQQIAASEELVQLLKNKSNEGNKTASHLLKNATKLSATALVSRSPKVAPPQGNPFQ